jgi:hypothetical protein
MRVQLNREDAANVVLFWGAYSMYLTSCGGLEWGVAYVDPGPEDCVTATAKGGKCSMASGNMTRDNKDTVNSYALKTLGFY